MKIFIVLSALAAIGLAKPSAPIVLAATPLAYSAPVAFAKLVREAPLGPDGRVVDTPEVNYAKAEHAAAHINEKFNLANEALKSADHVAFAAAPVVSSSAPLVATTTYAAALAAPSFAIAKQTAGGAPIGIDGRVVDTPEVAYAKAEHAAAHINHNIERGSEYLRNSLYNAPLIVSSYASPAYATGYIQHFY